MSEQPSIEFGDFLTSEEATRPRLIHWTFAKPLPVTVIEQLGEAIGVRVKFDPAPNSTKRQQKI